MMIISCSRNADKALGYEWNSYSSCQWCGCGLELLELQRAARGCMTVEEFPLSSKLAQLKMNCQHVSVSTSTVWPLRLVSASKYPSAVFLCALS